MPRSKQRKYHNASASDMLIEPGKSDFDTIKGQRSDFFGNNNPITLELACGKGEYTTGLGALYPDRNFIGIDIKADRMSIGIAQAQKTGLTNIAFVRTIIHHLDHFFAPGEVDEIRIIHPDPRPRIRDAKRRLTSPRFLHMYHTILRAHGTLRLKTDDAALFDYSSQQLATHGRSALSQTTDLHHSPLLQDHHGITTHFEQLFMASGRTICYGTRERHDKRVLHH